MAKVVLHIGAHKTATSYLQSLFHFNRDRLAAAGVFYPQTSPKHHGQHGLSQLWLTEMNLPELGQDRIDPETLWQETVLRPYADGPGTVFLSSETFCRFSPQKVDMADLADRLRAFDTVQIVYTMRRQTDLIPSIWGQGARTHRPATLRPFVKAAYTDLGISGVSLDHGAIYDHLLTGFAPEQITLLVYENFKSTPGGIGQVFLDLLGSGLTMADLATVPPNFSNISPDPLALWVAAEVARRQMPPADLIESIRAILQPDPARPATMLARHEYVRVRNRFVPLNRALVRRVARVQPGFTFPDIPSLPEDMMFRDDITPQHWIEIAATLYERQKPPVEHTWIRRLLRRE